MRNKFKIIMIGLFSVVVVTVSYACLCESGSEDSGLKQTQYSDDYNVSSDVADDSSNAGESSSNDHTDNHKDTADSKAVINIEDPNVHLSEDENTIYYYVEEDGKIYKLNIDIYTGEQTKVEVDASGIGEEDLLYKTSEEVQNYGR